MTLIGDRTAPGGPTDRLTRGPKLNQIPGFRMLYALGGALVFGLACGFVHAPFWAVVIGGAAAAIAAMRLEWASLGGAEVRQRPNYPLLLTAAFVFVAIVCVGVVSLGYFLHEWAVFKLAHR
jgi:hypothetical protein